MSDQPNGPSIDRRDFGRLAFGALAAAAAGSARSGTGGGGRNARHQAVRAVAGETIRRTAAVPQAARRPVRERGVDAGPAHGRRLHADQEALRAPPASPCGTSATLSVHNMPEVTLNLPGRDQKIEEYKQYLRNLGKAGIRYTTYAHMGNGIWTSGRTEVRGASAREFDQNSPTARGNWDGKVFTGPLSHGREFTPGRNLGELHLLHQAGRAGGRGERRPHRHPPGRSARARARRRASLHLQQLRRATSARWRSPTVPTSGSACVAGRGSRAARS